jgi:hypothetical protein
MDFHELLKDISQSTKDFLAASEQAAASQSGQGESAAMLFARPQFGFD